MSQLFSVQLIAESKSTQDVAINPQTSKSVSAFDRAFNYGDGCFTTMYADDKGIELLDLHLRRLIDDAKCLGIELDSKKFKQSLMALFNSKNFNLDQAHAIKVLVSRGCGGRGYELPEQSNIECYVSLHQLEQSRAKLFKPKDIMDAAIKVGLANIKLAQQPLLAGCKHLNRLEQVLAKKELLEKPQWQDLILCDSQDWVIEATAANLFYYLDGSWHTPELSQAGVNGVMRRHLIALLSKLNTPVIVKKTNLSELKTAKSVFLCNALRSIIPVQSLEHDNEIILYENAPLVKLAQEHHQDLETKRISI